MTKFIEIKQTLKSLECCAEKQQKAVLMPLKQDFQNLRKVSSRIFVRIMWSKFQQNRPKIVEIKGPDRYTPHTHTHTHKHTHRDRDLPGTTF